MLDVVVFLVSLGVRVIRAMCRRRADLVLENVALRQQVTALKKERPRPPLEDTERAFWVALRGSWPVWASRLLIVHADTVARWHRDRFRRYWAKISRRRHPGRPRIDAEIRRLVRTMAQDGWGAPRRALGTAANTDTKLLIHGLFQKGRVLAQDGEAEDEMRLSS